MILSAAMLVVATLVLFLLITPASREFLLSHLAAAAEWAAAYAPLSYVVFAAILAAPLIAWLVMSNGPKVQAPEDPLARYKHADDVLPD